jgi:hypothetical protein
MFRHFIAAAFMMCALCAGSAFAGEWITPERNLPVKDSYQEIGDQKYDDQMYSDYNRQSVYAGLLNTSQDLLGPERNLPVDNNFHKIGDRKYSPSDLSTAYETRASDFHAAPLYAPGRENLPVDNDYKEIGDPNFGNHEYVRP